MELPPWQRRGNRYVLHNRWIAVRADDCVSATGVAIAPHYVLEYPDWVQIVAPDSDDNVVMVRQYHHGIGQTCLGRGDAVDARRFARDRARGRQKRPASPVIASLSFV